MITVKNSPIEEFNFDGVRYFIKRDDKLHEDFSGNKARKFSYFLENPPQNIDKIISYGSNQSNAMYSLSVLAKMLHKRFLYACNHIPNELKKNPIGNFLNAQKNGMELFTAPNAEEFARSLVDEKSLFIKEGGAVKSSEYGLKQLSHEINEWVGDKIYDIFLPSGTGTTALYLQKHTHLKVYTCPCVGDEAYLKKQFLELVEEKHHPTILNPPKKYHFGKPKIELYKIYHELKEKTGIEFDLLYDSVGWLSLKHHESEFKHKILYIHQGGILGNESLLQRYKYKFGI